MIIVPRPVVELWQAEAAAATAASQLPLQAPILDALAASSPTVGEVVVVMAEALARAAGVLYGSATNATPGAPELFAEGLDQLARAVAAEQAADLAAEGRGEPGHLCPLPEQDGSPFRCGCGPESRRACEAAARHAGETAAGADVAPAGDDGCEGGPR